jgi:hypothetical protein
MLMCLAGTGYWYFSLRTAPSNSATEQTAAMNPAAKPTSPNVAPQVDLAGRPPEQKDQATPVPAGSTATNSEIPSDTRQQESGKGSVKNDLSSARSSNDAKNQPQKTAPGISCAS